MARTLTAVQKNGRTHGRTPPPLKQAQHGKNDAVRRNGKTASITAVKAGGEERGGRSIDGK